jgi:uncharacterized protein (DUF433 family)
MTIVDKLVFCKAFTANITVDDSQIKTTLVRQLLIQATGRVKDGLEEIQAITHTLDGKPLVLTMLVPVENTTSFVEDFTEETAKEIATKYCVLTLDQINNLIDLDLPHTGVE